QLWVNLPSRLKMTAPRYQDIRGSAVSLLGSPDSGALVRLIAGDLGEFAGPGVTHSPIAMLHATLEPGAELVLPWPRDYNALVYVLAGRGTVGTERRPAESGQLAVFGGPGSGDVLRVAALARQDRSAPTLDVLVLGGRPIGEPVVAYGPFVMNTAEEISQAMEDYRAGRLGSVPAGAIQPAHP